MRKWLLKNTLNGILLGFLDETNLYSDTTLRKQFHSYTLTVVFLYLSFLFFPLRALVVTFFYSKVNKCNAIVPLSILYRFSNMFAPHCLKLTISETCFYVSKIIFERYGETNVEFLKNDEHNREKKNVFVAHQSFLDVSSNKGISDHFLSLTFDKAYFSMFYQNKNIKCCPIYCVVYNVSDISKLPCMDLFVKPNKGQMGVNCFKMVYNKLKNEFSEQSLMKWKNLFCGKKLAVGIYPVIHMHDKLKNAIGVNTLCTLRIITHRFADYNIKCLKRAFKYKGLFRFTQDESDVDNAHSGGYRCFVSSKGYLTNATSFQDCLSLKNYPFCSTDTYNIKKFKTGVSLEQTQIPFFKEAMHLVKSAHRIAGKLSPDSIGWDVAICNSGPILVEANYCFYFGECMWY